MTSNTAAGPTVARHLTSADQPGQPDRQGAVGNASAQKLPPSQPPRPRRRVRISDLVVEGDPANPTIVYRGRQLEATRHEATLLLALMTRPIRTWPCAELERRVWGEGAAGDSHAVDVHVGYLRRRLNVLTHPVIAGCCETGYRLRFGIAASNG